MIALGVDVGGTFTDAVLVAPDGITTEKVLTTARQEEGVVAAARRVLERAGAAPRDVGHFVHGSTTATNALLERRLARTAFVTTEGFRDLLWLGRQARPSLYRLHEHPTPPVVARDACFEVRERMGPDGVVRALDERSVHAVAERLEGFEAVAVCLLFAFLDPAHEARVAALLRERLPDAFVVASHEVAAEVREFERATTTAVDAALGPPVGRYLERLRGAADDAGLPEPQVMLSSGGVATLERAAAHPAALLLSGPAGGAVAARLVAEAGGDEPALGFDMGGTSCDAFLLGGAGAERTFERRIAGLPVRLPMVDIHTVSAGGGSIAWVDAGGALRVGPRSAGSDPGPACYGRGGDQPTVTDANLLLGALPAESPIAGGVELDPGAARAALERLARDAGYDSAEAAATGVVDVAVNALVQALRVVSVERGHDPAGVALIAFGGAGALHACALADALGAGSVRCLPAGGVLSAVGLAAAERRRDAARSVLRPLAEAGDLAAAAAELAGARDGEETRAAADLRYAGQSFELTVPLDGDPAAAFHAEHARRYGHADPDRALELVTLRAAAVAPGVPVSLEAPAPDEPRRSRRRVHGWDAEVLAAEALPPGTTVTGPAVVEFRETTCVIPPGWAGEADEHGILRLERS